MRSLFRKSLCPSSAPSIRIVSFWDESFRHLPSAPLNALLRYPVTAILPTTSGEVVEFFAFDEAYVLRLREGDPSTESHFVAYFSQLVQIKLRARYLPAEVVDDLKQETFIRVIRSLRSEGGIHHADRLGPFVNSVCNNVLLEHYRSGSRNVPLETDHLEIPDKAMSLESLTISAETQQSVRKVLNQLPERDQSILRSLFLDELSKDEVCAKFGVRRDYLRVLLHRAKQKFRAAMPQ